MNHEACKIYLVLDSHHQAYNQTLITILAESGAAMFQHQGPRRLKSQTDTGLVTIISTCLSLEITAVAEENIIYLFRTKK